MKTKEEILSKIQALLEETFELKPEALVPEANLYEDLDLDSLDAIDLAAELSSIGIKLKEEEMRAIRTISDIVDILYHKLNPNHVG